MSQLARTSRTVETLVTHVKDRFLANEVLRSVTILDGLQNAEKEGRPPRIVFVVGGSELQFANLCNQKGAFATLLETIEVRAWGLVKGSDYGQDARLAAIELLKDVAAVAHDSYGANVTGGTIEPAKETHVVKYGEHLTMQLIVKCPVYRVDNSVPAHTAGGTNGV